jgi:hypothetical protein
LLNAEGDVKNTGWSKSLCASDDYSTKKTRKNILNSFNHFPW